MPTPDVPRELLTRGPPADNGRTPQGSGAPEVIRYLTEDHDRIAQRMNDVVVRRIFAAGLDLQTALGLIGDHRGAGKICHASTNWTTPSATSGTPFSRPARLTTSLPRRRTKDRPIRRLW
jgi:hypothetical protein